MEDRGTGLPAHVRVVNFEIYQHGGDNRKNLPWAKLYLNTLSDLPLLQLRASSFKLWIIVLLLAKRSQNLVPTDAKTLRNATHLTRGEVEKGFADLLEIGVVEPQEPVAVETQSRKSLEKVYSQADKEVESTKAFSNRAVDNLVLREVQ